MFRSIDNEIASNVRMLGVNGVKPTNETIKDGTYPFQTAYYIVINKADDAGYDLSCDGCPGGSCKSPFKNIHEKCIQSYVENRSDYIWYHGKCRSSIGPYYESPGKRNYHKENPDRGNAKILICVRVDGFG